MKQSAKFAILTLALGLFAAVLSSLPSHPAAAAAGDPPSLPVKVTNTPLPVQGNVNAAVTGNVNATILGTPSVNVLSAPPVNVTFPSSIGVSGNVSVVNPANNGSDVPLLTRDSDNPARNSFQGSISSVSSCGLPTLPCTGLVVPNATAGGQPLEALVIEYVSATCNIAQIVFVNNYPSGVVPVSTQDNMSAVFSHQFVAIPAGGKNVLSQQTRIYAAPGSTIAAETETVSNDCLVNISGYLVAQ
jgi:hypothetical protein